MASDSSKRHRFATVENAEAIRNITDRAFGHLRNAERELRDALMLARDDYDHNADKLEQMVGAAGLLSSALSAEACVWAGYATARARHRDRLLEQAKEST